MLNKAHLKNFQEDEQKASNNWSNNNGEAHLKAPPAYQPENPNENGQRIRSGKICIELQLQLQYSFFTM
jgi:hypothetical protein